jgi:hypothetical protein
MIKGITGSSHIMVSNNYTSMPYISPNTHNPATGMVRVNGQDFQVFDGNSWLTIAGGFPSIELDHMSQNVLKWAMDKMTQEQKWKELAKDNKAVKIALDNLEQAQQQLEITAHLAKENYETVS